jgi:ribosome-associated translation inhibitor RaiA
MKMIFVSNSVTEPTRETFEEVSEKRFRKIEKLLGNESDREPELRLSLAKEGNEFVVSAELFTFKNGNHISKSKSFDLRQAIQEASEDLKKILGKQKDRSLEIKNKT